MPDVLLPDPRTHHRRHGANLSAGEGCRACRIRSGSSSFFHWCLPYTLLIPRTFFAGVDQSLQESARIDGAEELRILFSIILPVSLPILATIGLMYGVNHWNTYFNSMIDISSSDRRTLQVVLREMLNRANKMEADVAVSTRLLQMAGVIISAVPIIAVYPFLQKYFTQGLMLVVPSRG